MLYCVIFFLCHNLRWIPAEKIYNKEFYNVIMILLYHITFIMMNIRWGWRLVEVDATKYKISSRSSSISNVTRLHRKYYFRITLYRASTRASSQPYLLRTTKPFDVIGMNRARQQCYIPLFSTSIHLFLFVRSTSRFDPKAISFHC